MSRSTTMKVVRSSKPWGPLGSTRTTSGLMAVTRTSPTVTEEVRGALKPVARAESNMASVTAATTVATTGMPS